MTTRVTIKLGMLLLMLVAVSGSACPRRQVAVTEPVPRVLPTSPTMAQLIEVVNVNRQQIHSLHSTQATLSGNGFPRLRASLAVAGTQQMRLTAGTGLTGGEIDLGSNQELFWYWVRRSDPPAIYYARHNEFAGTTTAAMMPVKPEWMVEAIGLPWLDPTGRHEGPYRTASGHWQIATSVNGPQGALRKIITIHGTAGWVLQQELYDPQGKLLAKAIASKHVRDAATGLTLPRTIDIQWPPAEMTFRLELDELTVNPAGLSPELFQKPQYNGFANIDMGRAGISPAAQTYSPQPGPPAQHWQGTNPTGVGIR